MMQDYSYWEHDAYRRVWDICIVGAGINGISAGISILEKQPSANVLIVDRWFIPLGASTRNAGFSCFGSPSEILHDIAVMGEDAAMSLVKRRWSGLQKLKYRLTNSNSQYETFGGYELYFSATYEDIHNQLSYLNQIVEQSTGLKTVFKSVDVPGGIKNFDAAVYNPYEGQLHPGFMMEHLKNTYLQLGGHIHTGLNIDAIEDLGTHVVLKNRVSIPLESKQVIITTNAFVNDLIPQLDVHGARNHVFVTTPVQSLSWKGCFHYDEGFYYFRNIGNRILLGGARNKDFENENTDQFGTNDLIKETLKNFLYTHLAEESVTSIEFQWSGIIAIGGSKSQIITSVTPRIHTGVRCSGMGIALASLTGDELADMVLQQ